MKLKITTVVLLTIIFIAPAFAALEPQRIYALDLEYNNVSLKLSNTSLISGFPSVSTDKENLFPPPVKDENFSISMPICELELLSKSQEVLYQGYFFIPNEITSIVPPIPGGQGTGTGGSIVLPIVLDDVNFSISLPYFKNGQIIRITENGSELLSIDVSKYQMYCGDGRCQSDESEQTCPADCAVGLTAQPQGNASNPPVSTQQGVSTGFLYPAVIIVLLVVGVIAVYKLAKK